MKRLLALLATGVVLLAPAGPAAEKLTTSEARQHVGQTATVCGVVASGRYSERARGKPTFLDIDKAYPQQIFTVVIWGENRAKFGAPERELRDRRVCVSGHIQLYQGKPEIVASEPRQIERQ
jgi:hypothetical protein